MMFKHKCGDKRMKIPIHSICLIMIPICGCLLSPMTQVLKLKIVEPVCEPACVAIRPHQCQEEILRSSGDLSDPVVDFFVLVRNCFQTALAMPAEWSSWGYDNLCVDLETKDGTVHHLRRRPCKWEKNVPFYVTVKSHESVLLPVSLDMRIWENMPLVMPGDRIRVKVRLSHAVLTANRVPIWDDVESGTEIHSESDWKEMRYRSMDGISPFDTSYSIPAIQRDTR